VLFGQLDTSVFADTLPSFFIGPPAGPFYFFQRGSGGGDPIVPQAGRACSTHFLLLSLELLLWHKVVFSGAQLSFQLFFATPFCAWTGIPTGYRDSFC